MRQFRAISLIALLALPGVICFCFLQWQKVHVRHELKEKLIKGIDRDSLTVLTFSMDESATTLNWEHDREFEYAGEMFDVVDFVTHGDSITYFCWKDHEETHLNELLSSLTAHSLDQDPQNKSQRSKTTDILKVHYLAVDHLITQPPGPVLKSPSRKSDILHSRFKVPPPTPPPVSS